MTGAFWEGEMMLMIDVKPYDANSPTQAPTIARVILSTSICVKIAIGVAPKALQVPIYLILSLMLASIMFMIPIPPTNKLKPAMIPPLIRAFLILALMSLILSS